MSEYEGGGSASGYLKVILKGNLGSPPELRYTPGGSAVCNFRVAVNVKVKVDGEWIVRAIWFKVTTWGKLAETCNQYLQTGSEVLVEADRFDFDLEGGGPKIFTRNDGSAGANYEVTAQLVKFGRGGNTNGQPAAQTEEEEVIPF